MNKAQRQLGAILAVIAAAAAAAYWYWSPELALREMQRAAKAGDADTFSEHVDYPRLRESMKGQMAAIVTDKLGAQASSSGLGALGAMIGLVMVDRVVDAVVRPEVVMSAIRGGRLRSPLENANIVDEARHTAARTDALNLETALKLYVMDNGAPPTAAQGLDALARKPTSAPIPEHWRGYLETVPMDPWGRPYRYQVEDGQPKVSYDAPPVAEQARPSQQDEVVWSGERKGTDKYLIYAGTRAEPAATGMVMVLERSGFATWKLTEIRMPK